MNRLFNRVRNYIRNMFLDDVDKAYEKPDEFRRKFRENKDPVTRIKERHNEYQDFNKLR